MREIAKIELVGATRDAWRSLKIQKQEALLSLSFVDSISGHWIFKTGAKSRHRTSSY